MKQRILFAAFGTVLVTAGMCLGSVPAQATPYTSYGVTEDGIGAQTPYLTSEYDILSLSSVNASITGSGTYLLSDVTFTVGLNCSTCTPPVSGSISENLTIGGETESITIPWNWSSDITTDTIVLASNGPYSFDSGMYSVSVGAAGPFSASLNDDIATGVLDMFVTQNVSQTPLPAALPLFATGFGVMGLFGWRRKRKNDLAMAAA